MPDAWASAAVGRAMRQVRRSVRVQAGVEYPLLGMRWYGEGPFFRETVTADVAKATGYFQVRAGDFIYNRLFGWKGSFGVVPERFDGFYVSGEFPVFEMVPGLALAQYVNLVMCRPVVWEQILRESTGSTATSRNRWNEGRFLEWEIPLPPLAEQRRIVDLISAVDASLDAADRLFAAAGAAIRSIREELIVWSGDLVPLQTLCSIQSRLVDPTEPRYRDLAHIGIERMEARSGRLLDLKSAAEDGVTSGKFVVDEHDLVYSKIRPELRKAVLPGFRALCSADAYPLRPSTGVDPRFLLELLLSDQFAARAVGKSGRTKMPKVNRSELMTIAVPFPNHANQVQVGNLASGLRRVADAAACHRQALRDIKAAFLEELLGGAHEIPASYDRFLDGAA
jgi:type I restriction enzyme S subunit